MFDNKMIEKLFVKIDTVVLDAFTGRTGIRHDDGIYSLDAEKNIEMSPFDNMAMPLPAFAQLTPMQSVVPGDIIVSAKKPVGWIIDKKEASLTALSIQGHQTIFRPKKVQMFGINDGVMVVKQLFNMTGDQIQSQGQMNPMMMMAMMGSDKIDPLMMMLMMGAGGNTGGMNPMMLAMMMSSKGSDIFGKSR